MKLITVGLDSAFLNPHSEAAERARTYGELVDAYTILVPAPTASVVVLSPKVRVVGVVGGNKLVQWWKLYQATRRAVREYGATVISAQDPFDMGLLALLVAREFRLGLHVQEHGDFFSKPFWKRESFLNRIRYHIGCLVLRRADAVRVVSERIKRTLINTMYIKEDIITVVPMFTDAANLKQQVVKEPKDMSGTTTIIAMGRFVKQKNFSLLLNAFAAMPEREQCVLRLVGKGPEERSLRARIRELHLENQVHIEPWTQHPEEWYSRATLFVVSSDYEGWGRVLIEAATAGVPIVTTAVGCAEEILHTGKSALIVPVRDTQGLSQAMSVIVRDPAFRASLVQGAFEDLKALPTYPETLERYRASWEKAQKK